jgi:hypothetical protein
MRAQLAQVYDGHGEAAARAQRIPVSRAALLLSYFTALENVKSTPLQCVPSECGDAPPLRREQLC